MVAAQRVGPLDGVALDEVDAELAQHVEGRLILEIGIAPLRPAEFVVLRIGLTTRPPNG